MLEDMKVVYGTIVDRNGLGYPRLGVRVLLGQKTLGQGQADGDGGFEVAIPVVELKRAITAYDRPALTVRAAQGTTLFAESPPIAVEADTQNIRVDLKANRARPLEGEPRSRVSGRVRDERGGPMAGLEISVIDRDLRSEEGLGTGRTDANGAYLVEYERDAARRQEFGARDIVVVAADETGELARSDIVFNAPRDLSVDLVITTDARRPEALFDRMDQVIRPLIGRLDPAELDETPKFADLSLIAGDTGIRLDHVAAYAVAHRAAAEDRRQALWFGALVATGFTLEPGTPLDAGPIADGLRAIATLEREALVALILEAADASIMAPVDEADVGAWAARIAPRLAEALASPQGGLAKLRLVLALDAAGTRGGARDVAAIIVERAGVFDDALAERLKTETGLAEEEGRGVQALHAALKKLRIRLPQQR